MAEIFISYARSTARQARRVAQALRARGYDVWQDDDLPPHRPYEDVIQERLDGAKAVLVLWSAEAVRSQWVRSEANRAREAHKLVQVSLDGTAPPMPFDQIHCAQLGGSATARLSGPNWDRVVRAIADLAAPAQAPPAAPAATGSRRLVRLLAALAAAVIAVGVVAGVLWSMRDRLLTEPPQPTRALKVAVLPFQTLSPGQDVRYFADSLQEEIVGAFSGQQIEPVSRSASDALRGAGAAQALRRVGARLVLDGSARRDGDVMHVRVHLDDPQAQTTLWSREFAAPVKDAAVLQSRVAHRMLAVLGCSSGALAPKTGLSDPALLSRFLHACDVFADWDVHVAYDAKNAAEYFETLRTLTAQAPLFATAQYLHAVDAAMGAKGAPSEVSAALRREAEAHLKQAVALQPGSEMGAAVQTLLLPAADWSGRERLLREAVARAPSSPLANFWLGALLVEVGRIQEALPFSRRSASGDMVYDWGIFNASILCGGGQSDEAMKEIESARSLIPESVFAQDIEVTCLTYTGQWDRARKSLAGPPAPGVETPYRGAATDAYLAAAISHAPADVAKARRLALEKAKQGPAAVLTAVSLLSAEGFLDDAFSVAERYDPNLSPGSNPNAIMFTQPTRNLRRDPRFMRLAARIGLVDYWRSSGHWPDFCAEPDLPYNCQAVAAKARQ